MMDILQIEILQECGQSKALNNFDKKSLWNSTKLLVHSRTNAIQVKKRS